MPPENLFNLLGPQLDTMPFPTAHENIDSLIGDLEPDKDTLLGLFASKFMGKDVPTSLTAGQIPPLSATGKVTKENLSDLWSYLNPPLSEGVQAPGLGVAEAIGPLVSPKNVGLFAGKLAGLMKRYPKSGIQKGINQLLGYMGKTNVFKEQMKATPLSGKMFQHYFTGRGKQLSYNAPDELKEATELAIFRQQNPLLKLTSGGPKKPPFIDLSDMKKGQTVDLVIKESMVGGDIASALGTSTAKVKKVNNIVLKIQNKDTYNFKPDYDISKFWNFKARVPKKIAEKLPFSFQIKPSRSDIARASMGPGTKNPILSHKWHNKKPIKNPPALLNVDFVEETAKFTESLKGGSMLNPPWMKGPPKRSTLIQISGMDAIFPKLGIGKPFTSLSKPYYYNILDNTFASSMKGPWRKISTGAQQRWANEPFEEIVKTPLSSIYPHLGK